ncbi:hypothetical protein FIBSPDRAFT_849441, partial [Athelia psychrophila]
MRVVPKVSGSLDVQAVALSFVSDVFLSSSSDLGLVNRLGDQSKRHTVTLSEVGVGIVVVLVLPRP